MKMTDAAQARIVTWLSRIVASVKTKKAIDLTVSALGARTGPGKRTVLALVHELDASPEGTVQQVCFAVEADVTSFRGASLAYEIVASRPGAKDLRFSFIVRTSGAVRGSGGATSPSKPAGNMVREPKPPNAFEMQVLKVLLIELRRAMRMKAQLHVIVNPYLAGGGATVFAAPNEEGHTYEITTDKKETRTCRRR